MFVHLLSAYGVILMAMGAFGNEGELVVLGLLMVVLGNLHRIGAFATKRKNRRAE